MFGFLGMARWLIIMVLLFHPVSNFSIFVVLTLSHDECYFDEFSSWIGCQHDCVLISVQEVLFLFMLCIFILKKAVLKFFYVVCILWLLFCFIHCTVQHFGLVVFIIKAGTINSASWDNVTKINFKVFLFQLQNNLAPDQNSFRC